MTVRGTITTPPRPQPPLKRDLVIGHRDHRVDVLPVGRLGQQSLPEPPRPAAQTPAPEDPGRSAPRAGSPRSPARATSARPARRAARASPPPASSPNCTPLSSDDPAGVPVRPSDELGRQAPAGGGSGRPAGPRACGRGRAARPPNAVGSSFVPTPASASSARYSRVPALHAAGRVRQCPIVGNKEPWHGRGRPPAGGPRNQGAPSAASAAGTSRMCTSGAVTPTLPDRRQRHKHGPGPLARSLT